MESTKMPNRDKKPRKKTPTGGTPAIWGQDAVLDVYSRIQAFVISRLGWQMGPDVVHKTMEGILQKLQSIRAVTESQFLAFCYQTARYKIADALRSKCGNRIEPLDAAEIVDIVWAGAGADPSSGVRSDLEYILALLRASKFGCAQILEEHFLLGIEPKELAVIYGISVDAVRMKLRRCFDEAKRLAKKHT